MFGVVYRFVIKPGSEDAFAAAWDKLTVAIREQRGAQGSRLHHSEGQTWFAYAQWPSRQQWEVSGKLESADPDASTAMRECLEGVETIVAGEVTRDLLDKA